MKKLSSTRSEDSAHSLNYTLIINQDFINDLLYYRTVFDRFIVKATDDEKDEENYKWTLKKPYRYDYSKAENKKTIEPRPSYELGYQDSNLENAGVRVQCLTIWR